MTIDYDRLRELLEQWQHGDEVRDQLEAQWEMELAAPDMARELLRLRRELTDLRDLMHTHAGFLHRDGQRTAADYAHNHAHRLTRLLNGDTE